MSTVLDLLRLSALLGGFLVCLVGEGWFLAGPLLHGSLINRKPQASLMRDIAVALMCGLILNYGFLLVVLSLRASIWVSATMGIFGATLFGLELIRNWQKIFILRRDSLLRWSGAGLVCLLVLGPILAEPIKDWDARSIWFFQARMAYLAGNMGPAAGWQTPGLDFAHMDYPKLLAGLASQVATVAGFWNEYFPKLALLIMLLPAILWLFQFIHFSLSSVLLSLLVIFGFYPNIWNGYMDGILATYFGISMLMFGKYMLSSEPSELITSLVCLLFLPNVKNEGILAVLAGFIPILAVLLWRNRSIAILQLLKMYWKTWLAAGVLVLPAFLWLYDKQQWNLVNDLQIGSTGTFSRLLTRLSDGSFALILGDAAAQLKGTGLLVGLLFLVYLLARLGAIKASYPALLAAAIYGIGILAVYLVTPMNLNWHLISSIDRTMLAVNGSLYMVAFLIFEKIENSWGQNL